MKIDNYRSEIVVARSNVRDRMLRWLTEAGTSPGLVAEIMEELPVALAGAETFLDGMTGIWRYEFGEAFTEPDAVIVGSNTWPPLEDLQHGIRSMWRHLNRDQRAAYFGRLSREPKHLEVLAEMIPAYRIASNIGATPDATGYGPGNTDVDWAFKTGDESLVLLDVKSRIADFLDQMRRADINGVMPAPAHDHSAMFRSVEGKFLAADPDVQLQGCWICSYITQNALEIQHAFDALDPDKVHFAIFGDWQRDVTILARRADDVGRLLAMFGLEASNRFVFQPA